VQPAPDFKPMNAGLRKRNNFSAIRTKHKSSLDMLACRGNSLQHPNEITKNKLGSAVIDERKETNHKQHNGAILK